MKILCGFVGSLLLVACESSGEIEEGGLVVRDSGEVQIVENAPLQPLPDATWTLSAEPVLEIGVVAGEPEYMFSRISSPRRLPNGSVAAVDRGGAEVRIFDSSGRYLRTVGRRGEGPGEFHNPILPNVVMGDFAFIRDLGLRRAATMSLDGDLERTVSLEVMPDIEAAPSFIFALSDGDLLAGFPLSTQNAEAPLPWRLAALVRFDPEGRNPVVFGEYEYEQCSPLGCGTGVPYGSAVGVAFHEGRIYVSRPDRDEIRVLGEDGKLIRLIRGASPQPLITDEMQEAFVDSLYAGGRTFPEESLGIFSPQGFPERVPGFQSFMVSQDGHLWTREYVPNYSRFMGPDVTPDSIRWAIYSPDGEYVGDISIPNDFSLSEIGNDYVLGVLPDELGVERVVMYQLIRP